MVPKKTWVIQWTRSPPALRVNVPALLEVTKSDKKWITHIGVMRAILDSKGNLVKEEPVTDRLTYVGIAVTALEK